MELETPVVCFDHARHSCIVVKSTPKKLFIIPMTSDCISLIEITRTKFEEQGWTPEPYPVGRAAAHYLAASDIIPMTKSARNQLEPITSPLDIAPAVVRAAAIAFVNTNNKRKTRSQLQAAAEDDPIPAADKEIDAMATAKKPTAKKSAVKKAANKPAAKLAKAKAAESTGRKPGVTAFIKDCLLKGMEPEEITMEIRSNFPDSKAGKPEIAWCKGQLKKAGEL